MIIDGLDMQNTWYLSVANVKNNVESLFCNEYSMFPVGVEMQIKDDWGVVLNQNRPNPFCDQTEISIEASDNIRIADAFILVRDMTGRLIWKQQIEIIPGQNIFTIYRPENTGGFYTYSLEIDGKIVSARKMIVY